MQIQEHIQLAEYTTLRLGGPARFFVTVESVDELREALTYAKENGLATLILGGGSNLLVCDEGFAGLAIHIAIMGTEYEEDSQGDARCTASAGEHWDSLVQETVVQGLWGLENLSSIPGTVGAAPVQNIGAYGVEVSELIDWVEVLDTDTLELHILTVSECTFGYRDSIFKHAEGRNYIVTRVAFRLKTYPEPRLEYKELAAAFAERSTDEIQVAAVRSAVQEIRARKLPNIEHVGTAGSFFKNPIVLVQHHRAIESWLGSVPSYPVDDDHVKIPLAWLLERLEWKGKREGAVGCWEKQPLCLVHYGGGTASELVLFAHAIMQDVKKKTAIDLETEVRVVHSLAT